MKSAFKFGVALALILIAGSFGCRKENKDEVPVTGDNLSPRPIALGATSAPAMTKEMQMVLDELAAFRGKPIETLTPAKARLQPSPADAVKRVLEKQGKPTTPEPVGAVEDLTIPGPAGEIPIRVYTPPGEGPFAVLLFIHGGGWVIGTNDSYDASARALCNAAKCVVVSPEYRKAPEAKFPAAHEDTFAAYKWVVQNAGQIKGDARRVAVAGESAGGNMAAVIALRARSEGLKPPLHQVLIYPVASDNMNSPSYQQHANAKPLNKPMMEWFGKQYFSNPDEMRKPWIALVKAERVEGVAPATIITAEIDPLMSDGQAYADKLKAAGVDVVYKNYPGVTHEFFGMGAVVPEAKDAVKLVGDRLRSAFAR